MKFIKVTSSDTQRTLYISVDSIKEIYKDDDGTTRIVIDFKFYRKKVEDIGFSATESVAEVLARIEKAIK